MAFFITLLLVFSFFSLFGLCRETCQLIDFLFRPLLDGTDEITSWTNMTNKTENGIFTSHGSFLTEGWSNEGLWQLDFDVQYTSTYYVGLMPLCSEEINPFTDAKVANYAYTMWESYNNGGGFGSSIASGGITRFTNTNVNHITIIKLSATQIKVIINETNEVISNVPNMANISTLHIGSRDNPSSRNTGGLVKYSNIEVKAL